VSPHLHYQIARARQQEIAAGTTHARHAADASRSTTRPSRMARTRVARRLAALGTCLAATTAVTVGGAHASSSPVQAGGHISASQLAREIRALEAKGYVEWQCTSTGTLMRNSQGDFVKLDW